MPKQLTNAVEAAVQEKLGLEPINIISIVWTHGGQTFYYADKLDILGAQINGLILDLSGVESVIRLDGNSSSSSISVKLDDTSGELKEIMDRVDIHRRPCNVYQHFVGLDFSEKTLLLQGEISSPVTWSEGERTLSFDIVTRLADQEVGFSLEQENTSFPLTVKLQSLIGQPWPLVFGTCINVPPLNLQGKDNLKTTGEAIGDGSLQTPTGLVDESLIEKIAQNFAQAKYLNDAAILYLLNAEQDFLAAHFGSNIPGTIRKQLEREGQQFQDKGNELLIRRAQILEDTKQLTKTFNEQKATVATEGLEFSGILSEEEGGKIPLNTQLSINVNGETVLGHFNDDKKFILDGKYTGETMSHVPELRELITKKEFRFLDAGSPTAFQLANINTRTRYYVANLIESTVHSVTYRDVDNRLRKVKTTDYSVTHVQTGNYKSTYVRVNLPENATDEVFITQTSVIGPNTIDILSYLIETYTTFDIDDVSFDYVKDKLANYPSNFTLFDKRNIIDLLQDIAYQARCAIWIFNNTVYIKYLPEEVDAIDTLTEDDIDISSLEIFCTDTEELVTKLIVTWKSDYSFDEPNQVILRNNVHKYGVLEETKDFFIYTNRDLVKKSAIFWLIRLSNTWKKLRFKGFLNKLKLDIFDTIAFDLEHIFLSEEPTTKAFIETMQYDTETSSLEVECWLPIRLGERTQYNFAWPGNISIFYFYPSPEEIKKAKESGEPGVPTTSTGDLSEPQKSVLAGTSNYLQVQIAHGPLKGKVALVPADNPIDLANIGPLLPKIPVIDPKTSQPVAVSDVDKTKFLTDYQNDLQSSVNEAASEAEVIPADTLGDSSPSDATDPEEPEVPVDADDTLIDKGADNPTFDYEYKLYDLDVEFKPDERKVLPTLPARVISPEDDDPTVYSVDSYPFGLFGDPEPAFARVLQLDSGETIPEGTWVFLVLTQDANDIFEFVMQPPIFI
jgi:hypothetical protein